MAVSRSVYNLNFRFLLIPLRCDASVAFSTAGQESHAFLHHWSNTDHVPAGWVEWRRQCASVASTGESPATWPRLRSNWKPVNICLRFFQNGVLRFCGFQVLAPQIFWCPAHSPLAVRTAMLDGWRARLQELLAEEPLTFVPTEKFDLSFKGGFKLWPKVKEDQESEPCGLTTGHHLGKRLPPDNQLKAQASKQK